MFILNYVQCEALYTWNFTQSFYKIWCVACTNNYAHINLT